MNIRFSVRAAGGRGFTILEVIISLMVFAMTSAALMAAMWRALVLTKLTREEIILTFIEKDLAARNQLKAYTAADGIAFQNDFATSSVTTGTPSWGVYNIAEYNKMIKTGAGVPTWEENLLYRGFDFLVEDLDMRIPEEDYQFTDFNGYGTVDEREVGRDINQDGDLDPSVAIDPDGIIEPTPSHGVEYDSRKMRQYQKLLKCTIGWDPMMTDKSDMLKFLKSGKHQVVYFSLYNPDTDKR